MKNQNPKNATAAKKARRETQPDQPPAAPLLTVTLDADASACVRRFAEEFGEDVGDVASGSILDTLPQALEEWETTKQDMAAGKYLPAHYWLGSEEAVRAARKRRIKAGQNS